MKEVVEASFPKGKSVTASHVTEMEALVRKRVLEAIESRVEGVLDLILNDPGIKAEARAKLFLAYARLGLGVSERLGRERWYPGKPTKAGKKAFTVLGGGKDGR